MRPRACHIATVFCFCPQYSWGAFLYDQGCGNSLGRKDSMWHAPFNYVAQFSGVTKKRRQIIIEVYNDQQPRLRGRGRESICRGRLIGMALNPHLMLQRWQCHSNDTDDKWRLREMMQWSPPLTSVKWWVLVGAWSPRFPWKWAAAVV